jgi:hypothetical protein
VIWSNVDRQNIVRGSPATWSFSRSVFAQNLCSERNFVLLRATRAFSRGWIAPGRGWWVCVVIALCQRGRVLFTITSPGVAAGCRDACGTAPRSGA